MRQGDRFSQPSAIHSTASCEQSCCAQCWVVGGPHSPHQSTPTFTPLRLHSAPYGPGPWFVCLPHPARGCGCGLGGSVAWGYRPCKSTACGHLSASTCGVVTCTPRGAWGMGFCRSSLAVLHVAEPFAHRIGPACRDARSKWQLTSHLA